MSFIVSYLNEYIYVLDFKSKYCTSKTVIKCILYKIRNNYWSIISGTKIIRFWLLQFHQVEDPVIFLFWSTGSLVKSLPIVGRDVVLTFLTEPIFVDELVKMFLTVLVDVSSVDAASILIVSLSSVTGFTAVMTPLMVVVADVGGIVVGESVDDITGAGITVSEVLSWFGLKPLSGVTMYPPVIFSSNY